MITTGRDCGSASWINKILEHLEERDAIHEKFSSSILDLQQKSSLKYLILEKKIKAMKDDLNIKDAQLHGLVGLKKGEELKSKSNNYKSCEISDPPGPM